MTDQNTRIHTYTMSTQVPLPSPVSSSSTLPQQPSILQRAMNIMGSADMYLQHLHGKSYFIPADTLKDCLLLIETRIMQCPTPSSPCDCNAVSFVRLSQSSNNLVFVWWCKVRLCFLQRKLSVYGISADAVRFVLTDFADNDNGHTVNLQYRQLKQNTRIDCSHYTIPEILTAYQSLHLVFPPLLTFPQSTSSVSPIQSPPTLPRSKSTGDLAALRITGEEEQGGAEGEQVTETESDEEKDKHSSSSASTTLPMFKTPVDYALIQYRPRLW